MRAQGCRTGWHWQALRLASGEYKPRPLQPSLENPSPPIKLRQISVVVKFEPLARFYASAADWGFGPAATIHPLSTSLSHATRMCWGLNIRCFLLVHS
jgi:hypothetical protein